VPCSEVDDVDRKLELTVVPVADVDRAKAFYAAVQELRREVS
jgi:predicted enzyme related to lactoylglutathione lyase